MSGVGSVKLDTQFYESLDTASIARRALGKLLVVPAADGSRVSGMIVETEAYLGAEDRGAHSFGGRRTPRNEVMYGAAGHAYVFFVYGMHYQFNLVTGPLDRAQAILIRALEPVEGVDLIKERRGNMKDTNLTSGPGKLCKALGIDRTFNGESLAGNRVWLEDCQAFEESEIVVTTRVGIDYAGEDALLPLRFYVSASKYVSRR